MVGESLLNDAVTLVLFESLKGMDTKTTVTDITKTALVTAFELFGVFTLSILTGIMFGLFLSYVLKHKRTLGFFQKVGLNILVP
eukprot:CAMPEP_0116952464 /NCGR_PEP_ID=MMETSP0467-20121206/40759_1 /TAXON_ID=283647 /ORGANISM="Mesodinium pulex, Strain SPMC105" /LENGTH=83 /DNA_ID=CAMNT_0004637763 /DNA_START=450 /DNA_END=701 /DNA_ORIENTATION=+